MLFGTELSDAQMSTAYSHLLTARRRVGRSIQRPLVGIFQASQHPRTLEPTAGAESSPLLTPAGDILANSSQPARQVGVPNIMEIPSRAPAASSLPAEASSREPTAGTAAEVPQNVTPAVSALDRLLEDKVRKHLSVLNERAPLPNPEFGKLLEEKMSKHVRLLDERDARLRAREEAIVEAAFARDIEAATAATYA